MKKAESGVSADWVLAEKFEELTGVTPMAIHNRRRAGVWLDGKHCAVVARRLYVNIKEADQWLTSSPTLAFGHRLRGKEGDSYGATHEKPRA